MSEIEIRVDGWPPAKSEARSMFAAGHPHASRVRELLEAARGAVRDQPWELLEHRPVGLEVVVVEPEGQAPPSDATNYLGGVADVLQADRLNADLGHLGDLGDFALYANDRQIREVRYRVERGERPRYQVRVWVL